MFPQPFLITPSNYQYLNRSRRSVNSESRRGMLILLVILIVIAALALGFGAWGSWDRDNHFRAKGVDTQGTAIERRVSRGRSTSYYITYRYTVNGQTYTHEESVSSSDYDRVYTNQKIAVRYLSDNPAESELAGHSDIGGAIFWLIIGLVLVGSSAFVFTRLQRLSRFAQRGQIMQGMITNATMTITRSRRSQTSYTLGINYVFRNPYGTEVAGKEQKNRKDMQNADMYSLRGAPVAVLYIDDKNYMLL